MSVSKQLPANYGSITAIALTMPLSLVICSAVRLVQRHKATKALIRYVNYSFHVGSIVYVPHDCKTKPAARRVYYIKAE